MDIIEVLKIDNFCKVFPLFFSNALYILMHIIEITDKASKILLLDSIYPILEFTTYLIHRKSVILLINTNVTCITKCLVNIEPAK